ncbi:MAG: hypothetical protein N2Z79_00960 [Candidatus Omnitrophica bacterium]|nr:hypothetical protein [Candidatus Omnitrophota bacterium]
MWLITTTVSAITVSLIKKFLPKELRLDIVSFMLWGGSLMILVDRILNYEGGSFFEFTTDGLIKNGFLLGLVMLIPIILVWLGFLIINNLRKP